MGITKVILPLALSTVLCACAGQMESAHKVQNVTGNSSQNSNQLQISSLPPGIAPASNPSTPPGLKVFVTSLSRNILGSSDPAVIDYWVNQAASGSVGCAQVAATFLNTEEFHNRAKSTLEGLYIGYLYSGLLLRNASASDTLSIQGALFSGALTPTNLAKQILQSSEFDNNCRGIYGFPKGAGSFSLREISVNVKPTTVVVQQPSMPAQPVIIPAPPSAPACTTPTCRYIDGLYRIILNREPDTAGALYWQQNTASGAVSCSEIAAFFIATSNFQTMAASMSASQYQSTLYSALLGRAADTEAINSFQNAFASGWMTKKDLARLILKSAEFDNRCRNNYGFANGAGSFTSL